jgi:hypothetical protein
MSEAGQIVEAEKGNNLSPRNLHLRLRVLEVIVLISLCLNLLHWYMAGVRDEKLQSQVNDVKQETGVR